MRTEGRDLQGWTREERGPQHVAVEPDARGCRSALTCCTPRRDRELRPRPGRPLPPPAGTRFSDPRDRSQGCASPACVGVAAGLWAAAADEQNPGTWCADQRDAAESGAPTCTRPHQADKAAGPLTLPQAPPLRPALRNRPIRTPLRERSAHSRCRIQS